MSHLHRVMGGEGFAVLDLFLVRQVCGGNSSEQLLLLLVKHGDQLLLLSECNQNFPDLAKGSDLPVGFSFRKIFHFGPHVLPFQRS